MSSQEVQSFLKIAPHYFSYVNTMLDDNKPMALAKIVGVFRVAQTNTNLKQDLLIIENLFYSRDISLVFDLKGSIRNRLANMDDAKSTNEDPVLLDENFIQMSIEKPLYTKEHNRMAMYESLKLDTNFLCSHLIMDYSLLVGIDNTTKELVVGIIDYIRPFTWDKRLEMVVKSTYSQLGGQGKTPTVLSPELYRNRFLESMMSYFVLVPDQWSSLDNIKL